MSTLNPTPIGTRRRGTSTAPRLGITESLDVVGLTPAPADTSGASRAGQLLQALGLAAGVAQAQTRLSITQERGERISEAEGIRRESARLAELEKRARETEKLATEADELERGLAVTEVNETVPQMLADINLGELTVPEGADTREFVLDLVSDLTEGQSEVFAESFRDRAAPSQTPRACRSAPAICSTLSRARPPLGTSRLGARSRCLARWRPTSIDSDRSMGDFGSGDVDEYTAYNAARLAPG